MRVRRRGLGLERGFTLVELMFAIAIIATASLMLCLTMSSQNNMNALARERSLATNAIRAYIEAMRQRYPAKDQLDMSMFVLGYNDAANKTVYPATQIPYSTIYGDPTTPADFLPTSALELSAMRDARGLVLKMSDETGYSWGIGCTSVIGTTPTSPTMANWPWSDNTMMNANTAGINTGTYSAHTCPYTFAGSTLPVTAGAEYHPSLSDLDSMGFVSLVTTTQVVGRDMNGDAAISNTSPSGVCVAVNSQLFVPCQINLSWKSGSGNSGQASGTSAGTRAAARSRQRITVYAAFGPIH